MVIHKGVPYETNDPPGTHYQLWDQFEGRLAFDVGANYGQSLRAMVTAGRFQHAVAFEPSDEAWDVLAREFGDDKRVTLVHAAVSGEGGFMQLSVCEGAIRGGELLSPAMVGNSPDPWFSGEVARRSVPCVTLDAMAWQAGMPDMVKVDTEGSEVRVLDGARTLIGTADWLIEWHSPELREECLKRLDGYRIQVIPYPYPAGIPPYPGEPQNGWIVATR